MTNTKNNVPIYAEEQNINQEQEIVNKNKIIPQGFVELTSYGGSHSTEGLPKTFCWRYNFAYENSKKWITLDIPQELMEKLDLEPGKNFSNLVFIAPEILKREPECGGITLKNEKEIFLALPGSRLVNEKQTQTKLSSEEIEELEKKLEELEIKSTELEKLKSVWRNKYLEEKESNGQGFQNQITELTRERDNIQWELDNKQTEINNLRNEINRLNNNLRTTQQEKDRIKNNLQTQLSQSQNERDNLQDQVDQLNDRIDNLNQQLNNSNVERDDYQNKWDGTEEELRQAQEIIRGYLQKIKELEREKEQRGNEIVGLRNKIGELETVVGNIERERDRRPNINITVEQWNNDYSKRPTQQQLNGLQSELDRTRIELNSTKKERDDYSNRWYKHVCSCELVHCMSKRGDCSCYDCHPLQM